MNESDDVPVPDIGKLPTHLSFILDTDTAYRIHIIAREKRLSVSKTVAWIVRDWLDTRT